MYLLALHEDSNANLSLFKDGKMLLAIAEERLSRVKHQGGFPVRSIKFILDKYNLRLEDIDVIFCANKYHPLPRILWSKFPTFQHSFLGFMQKATIYYQHAIFKNAALRKYVEAFNKALLRRKLKRPVELSSHHSAHAYSAYLTSGFDKAVAVSTDNFGDGMSSAVFTCENGICKFLYGSSALNSPGQFYGTIAQLLGINPLLAGKMTGLAGYGNPDTVYPLIKNLFSLSDDHRDFILPPLLFQSPHRGIYKKLKKFKKEDVAAAAQRRFEEVMLKYIKEAIRETTIPYLCLAGGVYGNVRLNKKISELDKVEGVFIHPAMNDQGISLGAGLEYLSRNSGLKPFKLDNLYFGPGYDNEKIEAEIKKEKLSYKYLRDIETAIAQLLAKGKIVARFSGQMEYGLRALGNRSILYQTTDKSVNDWLNKKLKRSEYMPFAPVTMEEYAGQCYANIEKVKYNAKFMTIAVDTTEWMKQVSPGVVHVDGTTRPQLLEEKDNPSYYKILKEYHKITGIPSLINTSFNMHEEPIVCTPLDALKVFKESGLDYLAIGNYLITKAS
ncbi:MAG: carbamoyltransferase [Candidatus Omnitrophica bacterium]|nr:carbamoyltransferase [Candidatus Omnitrophota bacterium]